MTAHASNPNIPSARPGALRALAAALAVLPGLGCIEHDVRHQLWLEADGTLTWAVLEEDITSSEADPVLAERDLASTVRAAADGEALAARGLAQLRPESLRVVVLRHRSPAAVFTEARYASVDVALRSAFEATGWPADVDLGCSAGRCTLDITLRGDDAEDPGTEASAAISELLQTAMGWRFTLPEGRFVEATGFRLEDGDRVAVPVDPDDLEDDDGVAAYRLTWAHDGAAAPSRP